MSAANSGTALRRGRARYVVAAVAALPLIEIVLAMVVAGRIGWGVVLLVILATMMAGMIVLRRGTPRTWATVRELAGRGPTPEHHRARATGPTAQGAESGLPAHGADQVYSSRSARAAAGVDLASDVLMLLAGLGLLFPGLLSAAVGLLLVVPAVRRRAAARLAAAIASTTHDQVNRMMASGQAVIVTEVGGLPSGRTTRSEHAGQARFEPSEPSEPSNVRPPRASPDDDHD